MALSFTTVQPAEKGDVYKFDPRDLAARFASFTGRQARGEEAIEAMAESLLLHGQEQAILYRKGPDGDPAPVSGHTRILAAARITEQSRGMYSPDQPFLIRGEYRQMNAEEALFHTYVENSSDSRTPLNDVDVAFFIRTVSETTGLNDSQIAAKLGKTPNWVSRHRKVLDLPAATQVKLAKGEINMEKVITLHKLAPEKQAEALANGNVKKAARATGAVVPHTDADFKRWVKDMMAREVDKRTVAFFNAIMDYRAGKVDDVGLTGRFDRMMEAR